MTSKFQPILKEKDSFEFTAPSSTVYDTNLVDEDVRDFMESDDEDDPSEVQSASYMIVSLGIGYLFPFSALTQPVDYWQTLFPQWNAEFPITAVFMWSNLVVLISLGNQYNILYYTITQTNVCIQSYLQERPRILIALLVGS